MATDNSDIFFLMTLLFSSFSSQNFQLASSLWYLFITYIYRLYILVVSGHPALWGLWPYHSALFCLWYSCYIKQLAETEDLSSFCGWVSPNNVSLEHTSPGNGRAFWISWLVLLLLSHCILCSLHIDVIN